MTAIKRVSNALAWNHANKLVSYFLDFLLSIILARGLGIIVYGIYAEVSNIIFLAGLFCSFGTEVLVQTYIPRLIEKPKQLSALLRWVFLVIIILSIITSSFLLAFKDPIGNLVKSPQLSQYLQAVAFYVVFLNIVTLSQAILISIYQIRYLFLTNMCLKILFITISSLLIEKGYGIANIIWAFGVISAAISLTYMWRLFPFIKVKPDYTNQSKQKRLALLSWQTKFLNYFLGRYFDILLLGYFAISKAQIGFYNLAFTLTLALSYSITSGFGGITMVAFSEMADKKDYRRISKGWYVTTKFIILFSFPLFLSAIYFAQDLIILIYSEKFSSAAPLFQTFASFYLMSLLVGSGINSTILYALGKASTVLYMRILTGIVNIILDLILIQKFQAMGALIATGFSIFSIVTLELLILQKHIKLTYPYEFLMQVAGAFAVGFVTISVINIDQFVFRGVILIAVFILMLFLLKPFSASDLKTVEASNKKLSTLLFPFVSKNNA